MKNEPAFPLKHKGTKKCDCNIEYVYTGITKREYFAGLALNGMFTHSTRYRQANGYSSNWHEAISQKAFELADAMIAESEKTS